MAIRESSIPDDSSIPKDALTERAFVTEDFDTLLEIERHAGNAGWDKAQLAAFTGQLHMDTRVITTSDLPADPIAFYVVEHGGDTLYLCNLAVAPDWRRRGVAQFALDSASSFALRFGYSILALNVQEENLAAQLLYRKAGFRAVSIEHNFYRGQDGYRMVKEVG